MRDVTRLTLRLGQRPLGTGDLVIKRRGTLHDPLLELAALRAQRLGGRGLAVDVPYQREESRAQQDDRSSVALPSIQMSH